MLLFTYSCRMFTLHLKDYDIVIGDFGTPLSDFLKKHRYSKIAILVDGNTKHYCLPLLLNENSVEAEVIEIAAGELHKNIATCQLIWQEMMQRGLDRRSLLINLGGGVIGDMGGFCAATYLRGIDFVQMPTTLLSQVDASIGGKLGVDFNFVKNSIGVFQDPKAVFVDSAFLRTLPDSEIRSGFAEVFKHALIADASQWNDLKKISTLKGVNWPALLAPSLSIKQHIVEEDPREKGIRKALNFGHTIGHAVESYSLQTDNPLLHGEAVALGIICESWLSHRVTGLPEADLMEIAAFVRRFYSPFPLETAAFPMIFELMRKDKKNLKGNINFTLLKAAGKAIIDQYCDEALIRESLLFYQSLD
jgi:3-dehydroquinate synthase